MARLGLPYGLYSGLNLNQDKATKPQTVQIVRQGEATPYWFKVNPLYCFSHRFAACADSNLIDSILILHRRFEGRLKI